MTEADAHRPTLARGATGAPEWRLPEQPQDVVAMPDPPAAWPATWPAPPIPYSQAILLVLDADG